MRALASGGWRTIDVEAFLRGHHDGGWPARTFLLTFDDGYRNVLDTAMPIASDCSFTGIVFVASDRVGGCMRAPGEPSWTPDAPLLDWNGLRTLASAGWTIASHAQTHTRLTTLAAGAVARELTTSKTRIEDEIGAPATLLAYPYGAVSEAVERLAGQQFAAAFGTTLAYATPASRRTAVERLDAYYLRGRPIAQLDRAPLRAYMAVRRAGRALRPRSL
jgi:peptidoglycan/xylan/chitin deacetylase (PgdA/CDA1 family)